MGEPVSRASLKIRNLLGRLRGKPAGVLLATALLCLPGLGVLKAQPTAAPAAKPQPAAPPAAPASAKAAGQTAACVVRVVHALRDGHEFDAQLEPLRPQLTKPPLSAWHQFRLLKQHSLIVGGAAPSRFELPDGHDGLLTYEGLVEAGGKKRLRVRLEILDGQARLLSTRLLMNSGATLLQAGIKHDKGLLVLGITCQLSP
ncbi:MAG TPA: hypothetical protein PLW65_13880 [Pseudomonadota bacterium]|nr:hypothetical protein [Pseudomonadota bacterium]